MATDTEIDEIAKRRDDVLTRLTQTTTPPPVLVAVSKQQSDARIDAMLATGQRVFGENRVQEADSRWSARRTAYPALQLRLIGPLQSNKAEDAVRIFDVIETLDRSKLVHALKAASEKLGKSPELLIQVNTGNEPQKAGVSGAGVEALLREARSEGLNVTGLMCIPPAGEPAAPHFAFLALLAKRFDLSNLSMGMSGDYEVAARLGATCVRVGTALFGER